MARECHTKITIIQTGGDLVMLMCTDYVAEANTQYSNLLLSTQLPTFYRIYEVQMIQEVIENGFVAVIEDTNKDSTKDKKNQKAKDAGSKIANFFKKIVQFLKDMINRFKEKLDLKFKETKKWLAERRDQFKEIEYDDFSMSVTPYWKGSQNAASDALKKLQSLARFNENNFPRGTDTNEVLYTRHLKKYLGKNDDPSTYTNGLKNLLRVGDVNGLDDEEIKGSQVKDITLNRAIPYIESEHEKAIREVEKISKDSERIIGIIEKEMERREIANENYLFSIGEPMSESVLGYNQDVVLEDTKKDKKDLKDSEAPGRTSVRMDQDGDKDVRDTKKKVGAMSDRSVTAYRNIARGVQITAASAVTIAEERYVYYSNFLKTVWRAGKLESKGTKE